jgi:hypothetical protein
VRGLGRSALAAAPRDLERVDHGQYGDFFEAMVGVVRNPKRTRPTEPARMPTYTASGTYSHSLNRRAPPTRNAPGPRRDAAPSWRVHGRACRHGGRPH